MIYFTLFLAFFIVAVLVFVIYAGNWLSNQKLTINVPRKVRYVETTAFPEMIAMPNFIMSDPTEFVETRITEAKYQVETIRSSPLVFTPWMHREDHEMRQHIKRQAEFKQQEQIFKALKPFFETKTIEEYGPYGEPVQETQIMVLRRMQ